MARLPDSGVGLSTVGPGAVDRDIHRVCGVDRRQWRGVYAWIGARGRDSNPGWVRAGSGINREHRASGNTHVAAAIDS